jgi:hypothetical protein
MVLAQNRYEDQWNRIKDPDINSRSYAHLSFYKGAKNMTYCKIDKMANVIYHDNIQTITR